MSKLGQKLIHSFHEVIQNIKEGNTMTEDKDRSVDQHLTAEDYTAPETAPVEAPVREVAPITTPETAVLQPDGMVTADREGL